MRRRFIRRCCLSFLFLVAAVVFAEKEVRAAETSSWTIPPNVHARGFDIPQSQKFVQATCLYLCGDSGDPLDGCGLYDVWTRQLTPRSACSFPTRCYDYPGFRIKSVADGDGDSLFLIPIREETPPSECKAAEDPGQIPFTVADQDKSFKWRGILLGVLGDYIVLDSLETLGAGTSFGVFDSGNGKSLFTDNHAGDVSVKRYPSAYELAYRRIYNPGCSLARDDEERCWNKVKKATGLVSKPNCRKWIGNETLRLRKEGLSDQEIENKIEEMTKKAASAPSLVMYSVSVMLDESSARVSTLNEPAECFPRP